MQALSIPLELQSITGERLACWLLRRRILRRQGRQARGRLRRLPGPAGAIRAPFGRHDPRPLWLGSSAREERAAHRTRRNRSRAGRVPSCGTLCLKVAGRLGAARTADCLRLHPTLTSPSSTLSACRSRPKEAISPNPGDPSRRAVTSPRYL